MTFEEIIPSLREGKEIKRKAWDKKEYIQAKAGYKTLSIDSILADDWELFIDWDFVINNYIICWFWDDDKKRKRLGFLVNVDNQGLYEYRPNLDSDTVGFFSNCEPVRGGEYEFY